jgi:hypothetical protein
MEINQMRRLLAVSVLGLVCFATPAVAQIAEKPNAPLGVTYFLPEKNPEVSTRIRLARFKLKTAPVIAQSTNHQKKDIVLDVKVTAAIGGQEFTNAAVTVTVDGEMLGSQNATWTPERTMGNYAAETMIETSIDLVRRIANGKEVFLSVTLPGVQAPFNQISFTLSPEQIANFKLMADKYDSL